MTSSVVRGKGVAVIRWGLAPFYRNWKWRRPLWSLNPICWWLVVLLPGQQSERRYLTLSEAKDAMRKLTEAA